MPPEPRLGDFATVASRFVSTEAPNWLPNLLRDWAPSLMMDRAVHEAQPTKAQMRKRLGEIAEAAVLLQQALQDAPTKEFLELEGHVQIENIGGLDHALRTIRERATLAAQSPRISAASGTARRGRGKALPTGALSPKIFCAIIVSEIWKYLHGRYPGAKNGKAAAAAQAYWLASGGESAGWGSDPLSGWRDYFVGAKAPAGDKLRQEVRRHCIEHSHLNQMLSEG
jgi:hypothetical protein